MPQAQWWRPVATPRRAREAALMRAVSPGTRRRRSCTRRSTCGTASSRTATCSTWWPSSTTARPSSERHGRRGPTLSSQGGHRQPHRAPTPLLAGGHRQPHRAPIPSPRRESIVSLKRKYLKHEAEEGAALSQLSMDGVLDAIAKDGCSGVLEEVFLDLEVGASSCPPAHLWDTVLWTPQAGWAPRGRVESHLQ